MPDTIIGIGASLKVSQSVCLSGSLAEYVPTAIFMLLTDRQTEGHKTCNLLPPQLYTLGGEFELLVFTKMTEQY